MNYVDAQKLYLLVGLTHLAEHIKVCLVVTSVDIGITIYISSLNLGVNVFSISGKRCAVWCGDWLCQWHGSMLTMFVRLGELCEINVILTFFCFGA
jgi:hypothetical protein